MGLMGFLFGIIIASILIIFYKDITGILVDWEIRDYLINWLNSWESLNGG